MSFMWRFCGAPLTIASACMRIVKVQTNEANVAQKITSGVDYSQYTINMSDVPIYGFQALRNVSLRAASYQVIPNRRI